MAVTKQRRRAAIASLQYLSGMKLSALLVSGVLLKLDRQNTAMTPQRSLQREASKLSPTFGWYSLKNTRHRLHSQAFSFEFSRGPLMFLAFMLARSRQRILEMYSIIRRLCRPVETASHLQSLFLLSTSSPNTWTNWLQCSLSDCTFR